MFKCRYCNSNMELERNDVLEESEPFVGSVYYKCYKCGSQSPDVVYGVNGISYDNAIESLNSDMNEYD